MKTIGLIFGSTDSEHDISIQSATSVYKNFPVDKYKVLPIYIRKDGMWITGDYTIENFEEKNFPNKRELIFQFSGTNNGLFYKDNLEPVSIDGAILMLHGPVGEGGSIQGLLDLSNIPYTGSDLTSSAVCMDKGFTHQICEREGIKMAKYQLVTAFDEVDYSRLEYPCVVKPSREGSSFGISYVETEDDLEAALETGFKFDRRVLIEEYIPGQELSVGILKTKDKVIISKPCQSTRFKPIADFEEKYISEVQETLFDPPYSKDALEFVSKEGEKVFDLLDCRHFSRVDFFITEDEEIYFNEINTIPGFTDVSLFPMLMEQSGLGYSELIETLISDIL